MYNIYIYIYNRNYAYVYIYIYIYILASCIIRDYVTIVIHSPNVSFWSLSVVIFSKRRKVKHLLNRIIITYSFVTRGLLKK